MNRKVKTAVLGCTGYTGIELIKIISHHKNLTITFLGSENHSDEYIYKFDDSLKDIELPKLKKFRDIDFKDLDLVFFALPHNISQNIIKDNIGKCVFIDLSADFRLQDPNVYKKNYGCCQKSS